MIRRNEARISKAETVKIRRKDGLAIPAHIGRSFGLKVGSGVAIIEQKNVFSLEPLNKKII